MSEDEAAKNLLYEGTSSHVSLSTQKRGQFLKTNSSPMSTNSTQFNTSYLGLRKESEPDKLKKLTTSR